MRLLQICDDGSPTFTKDIISHNDIPKYAIISHTWGSEGQEVPFADMIDTCCINKSNSSELSEVINSMFRRYKHAAKCYRGKGTSGSDLEREFSASRWFTRGWTLQELLAPSLQLGSKRSLEKSHQRRETTRPEDEAYSLLGRFRVHISDTRFLSHMPLIYGEGEHHAFERL
ncbi:heterokaryon incompatibility protein-domain-containing protein [Xylaria acuta]|nr:heterokaryon incompatibility protein-domain-containing protein [Xylaria acuta]